MTTGKKFKSLCFAKQSRTLRNENAVKFRDSIVNFGSDTLLSRQCASAPQTSLSSIPASKLLKSKSKSNSHTKLWKLGYDSSCDASKSVLSLIVREFVA